MRWLGIEKWRLMDGQTVNSISKDPNWFWRGSSISLCHILMFNTNWWENSLLKFETQSQKFRRNQWHSNENQLYSAFWHISIFSEPILTKLYFEFEFAMMSNFVVYVSIASNAMPQNPPWDDCIVLSISCSAHSCPLHVACISNRALAIRSLFTKDWMASITFAHICSVHISECMGPLMVTDHSPKSAAAYQTKTATPRSRIMDFTLTQTGHSLAVGKLTWSQHNCTPHFEWFDHKRASLFISFARFFLPPYR